MTNIIAGTASQDLSKSVAKIINAKIVNTEVVRFSNSELRVRIIEDVSNKHVTVIQSGSNPTDLRYMELFFTGDALKRSEVKKITVVIPYFGYARQNIQHRRGEDVSANVIIKFLETIGFDEFIIFDIHDEATLGIFSKPVTHLSALPLLANKLSVYLQNVKEGVAIVTPDQAGVERARTFAKSFLNNNNVDVVVVEKKRDLDKIHESKAIEIFGDVKNKTAIIVDDIVTSGNTLLNAAELVLKNGATEVYAAFTHADFAPETLLKLEKSKIKKIFITDTITLDKKINSDKIEIVSIDNLVAAKLKKNT